MAVAMSPLNHLICKLLDYYCIVGSFIGKVPQLRKIWLARSGQGIALTSVTIELLAHCSKTAYSVRREFPFTSYGEGVSFIFQNCAIAFLVLHFSKRIFTSWFYPILTLVVMGTLLSPELVDMKLLMLMQAGNLLVTIVSKMIQAVTNVKNQGTGQLSKTTTSLFLSGLLARVYTSIHETGDVIIVSRYLVSTFLHAVLLLQIIYYRRKGSSSRTKHAGNEHNKQHTRPRNGHTVSLDNGNKTHIN